MPHRLAAAVVLGLALAVAAHDDSSPGAAAYRALQKEVEALAKTPPTGDMALCVTEAGPTAPETFITIRGNANVQGARVEPGFPAVLGGGDAVIPPPAKGARTTGRRTVLANWIASADNPMTARVMANRVWQFHFGRGIVRSPNNFGLQGDRPTHPELLDWLAGELVSNGWRLKEGSVHATGAVPDMFVVQATHTYVGAIGTSWAS